MRNATIALTGALFFVAGGIVAQDTAPNDAQIAAIVVTANQVDIDAGKFAATKASSQ